MIKSVYKQSGADETLVLAGDATVDRLPGLTAVLNQTGENFARFLTRYVDGALVAVDNVQGCRLVEISEKSDPGAKIYVFRSAEDDFRLAVSADHVLRNMVFELLLGSGVIETAEDRAPTRIEDRIIGYSLMKLVSGFAEAFSAFTMLHFEREYSIEGAGFLALGARAAVVAYARMTLSYGEQKGQIIFALPRSALDPFRAALSRPITSDGAATDEKWSERLYNNVVRTEVRADVRIEARGLTLGDIARLEVGDLLKLPIAPTDPIRLVAEDRTLFWCTLGQKDGMYTVRLEEFSDPRESYIENILGF
jgi:flagellar motor switch protein FliM